MSTTIASVFLQFAVIFLPMMGIQVGSDQLTVAVQTIVVIATGVWIWIQRVQKGDVKLFGGRKPTYST